MHKKTNTVVPPYLQGIYAKTPGGYLKPSIVPNLTYAVFPMHAYL